MKNDGHKVKINNNKQQRRKEKNNKNETEDPTSLHSLLTEKNSKPELSLFLVTSFLPSPSPGSLLS